MSQRTIDGNIVPKGYEQITSLSSAATLTIPEGADSALIQAEDIDVRWRDDGVVPTSGAGMLITAGLDIWYTGDLSALQFIEISASAKLNISYYAV